MPNDSKRNGFPLQFHSCTTHFGLIKHKKKLGILTGTLLFILCSMCLLMGQFAKIFLVPPSSTVGLMLVLLK